MDGASFAGRAEECEGASSGREIAKHRHCVDRVVARDDSIANDAGARNGHHTERGQVYDHRAAGPPRSHVTVEGGGLVLQLGRGDLFCHEDRVQSRQRI